MMHGLKNIKLSKDIIPKFRWSFWRKLRITWTSAGCSGVRNRTRNLRNVKQMCYRQDCDLPAMCLSSFTDALQMSAVEWEGIC